MVREKGLEPSRPKALVPKTSVSTNSTTRAKKEQIYHNKLYFFGKFFLKKECKITLFFLKSREILI